jgi:hypothetical protein
LLGAKKQGWERRERRKRKKTQPCKKLLFIHSPTT